MSAPPLDIVTTIVADALGERPSAVEHVPTLEDSDVFRVHLPSGVVFFKAEHEGHPIDVAAWAYRKAASVGVPVPEVLGVDQSRERWPAEFMLITGVEGSDLQHDPLEGPALVRALEGYGELLRRLHGVELEGFGDLVFPNASATDPVGKFGDHASSVRASTDWGLPYLLEHGLVGAETAGHIREILERHEELFTGPEVGVLLHDDAGLDHLFLERSSMRITGLIDFEPRSGDPMWDLATFAFHYPGIVGHLLGGYGTRPDDAELRFELYGLSRAVGCARWEHERDIDIQRPLDEISRRCSLLLRLLA